MKKLLAIIALGILCSGCGPSVRSICSENPTICQDLSKDTSCKSEKDEIVFKRNKFESNPDGYNAYHTLIALQNYKQCMWKETSLPKQNQAIEKTQLKGYLAALQQIKMLEEDTAESDHPHLLYYQWSRKDNSKAGDAFLALENTDQLNYPELQIGLAAHYLKTDLFEGVMALYRALQYSTDGIEEVDHEIYQTLTGIYFEEEEIDKAYIWAYIAAQTKKYQKLNKPLKVDLKEVAAKANQLGLDMEKLKEVAELYMDEIDDGEFLPPV